jgi:hypothetical protein
MGDFRRVQNLFWKTVKPPVNWTFLMFWKALVEEEMRKAFSHIDNLTLSSKHLPFIMLYEDYLFNRIPEDWLENASFEDWHVSKTGERVHPPSTLLSMYTFSRYPEIEKLYFAEKKREPGAPMEIPGFFELLKQIKQYRAIRKKIEKITGGKGKRFKIKSVSLPQEWRRLPFFSPAVCPECKTSSLIWDYINGEVVCKKCGVVVPPY